MSDLKFTCPFCSDFYFMRRLGTGRIKFTRKCIISHFKVTHAPTHPIMMKISRSSLKYYVNYHCNFPGCTQVLEKPTDNEVKEHALSHLPCKKRRQNAPPPASSGGHVPDSLTNSLVEEAKDISISLLKL